LTTLFVVTASSVAAPTTSSRADSKDLLSAGEASVDYTLKGEPQYSCEYLNDMDARQIIHDALKVAPPEQIASIAEKLRIADEAFLQATVLVDECIWGRENAKTKGWDGVLELVVLPEAGGIRLWTGEAPLWLGMRDRDSKPASRRAALLEQEVPGRSAGSSHREVWSRSSWLARRLA